MEPTRTTLQLRNSLSLNPYAMPDYNLLKLSEESIEL